MIFWLSLIVVFFADQITKYYVMTYYTIGQSKPFIDHILNITYVQNPGAAFSMLAGKSWISLVCAVIVMGTIVYYICKYKPGSSIQFFLGIMAGGALGNFIDRCLFNYVRDFFDLGWFPVFNVADIGIVCGGILLVVHLLFLDGSTENHERN
ncbi:MAG TPA: signal peptidase II [Syntrophomonadaceae bacterium]|nr:signal peptidase II [Syntrophomonadaceae bacterium]